MGRQVVVVLYVLAMAAVIVGSFQRGESSRLLP